jgi:hypothetical protein
MAKRSQSRNSTITAFLSKLNSLLLLHCHKERTDLLDLKDIAQKFVLAVDQRALVFGHFD